MDFGLYLHLPWCRIKCGYCDFYSLPTEDDARIERQGRALLDLAAGCLAQEPWRGGRMQSVYVGGGTPSLLPVSFFRELVDRFGGHFSPDVEFTVEMNPETLSAEWLCDLRSCGVTRASMGVQSLQPHQLKRLDRAHRPDQVARAVDWIRTAGFPALCLDLIYQLSGQPDHELLSDLEQFMAWRPEHLSAYGLTVESGTRLAAQVSQGRYTPMEADRAAEQFTMLAARLREAGYLHYEISNFALPGQGARHNSLYWLEGAVLGVGPSAVSSWTDSAGNRRRQRFPADSNLLDQDMSQALATLREEELDLESAWLEALYLGMRWQDGLDPLALDQRFPGRGAAAFTASLERAGLLSFFAELAPGMRQKQAERLYGKGCGRPWLPPARPALRLLDEAWLLLDEVLVRMQ